MGKKGEGPEAGDERYGEILGWLRHFQNYECCDCLKARKYPPKVRVEEEAILKRPARISHFTHYIHTRAI